MRTDCDQDALWLRVKVRGDGVACHTGAPSCFYRALDLTASETPATSLVRKPLPGVQGERKDV
jgi:phosphoribosyl-AMP cyclohydrolase